MKSDIYLRPLRVEDAKTSYKWRNDSKIWEHTGNKPDRQITPEIEKKWLSTVLEKRNEKRFAICLKKGDKYIGNVQLTNIANGKAEFHIFIGDKSYWGKGIGGKATKRMIDIGFKDFLLEEIYLEVDEKNKSAIKIYQNAGFILQKIDGSKIQMNIKKCE